MSESRRENSPFKCAPPASVDCLQSRPATIPVDGATDVQPSPGDAPPQSSCESAALLHEAGPVRDAGPPSVVPEESSTSSPAVPSGTTHWSLVVLTTLAILWAGYAARAVVLPIAFAVLLALTLRPIVRQLRRRGVPVAAGSAAVLLLVLGVLLTGATYLVGPARDLVENAPESLRRVGERLAPVWSQWNEIQEASEELDDLTTNVENDRDVGLPAGPSLSVVADDQPVPVEVRQPRLASNLTVLNSAGSFLTAAVLTLVLTYFLLSSSDVLINNVLRILPSMREKRSTVELVYNVEQGISSYLFAVTCINVVLGVAEGIAMWLLGMPNPALWGAMCCLLNFIPYVGALVGTIVVALVAVLTFDGLGYAMLVPTVYFSITAIEGNVVTPAVVGRAMQLNPVIVFLFLTFWGWMWGIGGALLAVPLLTVLKISFDKFERTRAIGTLLGD